VSEWIEQCGYLLAGAAIYWAGYERGRNVECRETTKQVFRCTSSPAWRLVIEKNQLIHKLEKRICSLKKTNHLRYIRRPEEGQK
jgi:hypothetical protein